MQNAIGTFFLYLLLVAAGCESQTGGLLSGPDNGGEQGSVYVRYNPVKIDILPLTEIISADDEKESRIKAYVNLLDAYGCQVKAPGVFRFELYQRVARSIEPKGRRIAIWPDKDLNKVDANNKHWRDFLRAYEFELNFEPQDDQSYILQVTCLCPSGKHLTAEFDLNHVN